MSQPISVSVQMDAASFHDFAAFDLLRHRKAWHRPLAFTAILLVSACVCLSQVGQKDGAALLTVVLAVVALGVLTVLIAFSRMYLGVHTPLDVGVSFLIAAVLVLVVYPLMEEADRRSVVLTYTILAMVVCSGAFVGYLYMRGDTGATAEDTAN